jgi:glycosyltransferase involved in cell wall biosynthesis
MNGKKVLFVATVDRTILQFLLPYAAAIREQGALVDAMCRSDLGGIDEHFRKIIDVRFTRNPFFAAIKLPRLLYKIKRILKEEKYDIVHVHTPIASFITRLSIALMGKKERPRVIYTAHGFHFHPMGHKILNLIYMILEKLGAKFTDYLITINKWDYEMAKRYRFLQDDKIIYINGIGVDAEYYNAFSIDELEIAGFRRDNGLNGDIVFVMIAEFIKRKRHIDVIKALERMNNSNVKVLFVGDGKLKDKILKKVKKRGLEGKVIYLGYRRDIPLILRASDCMILPSIREGLPRSIMEAMAMGVPVIGTDIRGVRELLEDGCGILVKPKDAEELAKAMELLIENKEQAREMAKRARKKILNEYELKILLPKYMEVYKRALQVKGQEHEFK